MKKNLIKLIIFILTLMTLLGLYLVSPAQTQDVYAYYYEEDYNFYYEADFGKLSYVVLDDNTVEITGLRLNDEFTEVIIPTTIDDKPVTSIGEMAFYNNYRMTQIHIPDSVSNIGKDAFACSHNLTSIRIPDAVTTIPSGAFAEGLRLETIEIPETVTHIGARAFDRTPWMTARQKENPFVIVNGMLINGQAVSGDAVVPETVHTIIEAAFSWNMNLTSIKIPNTVTTIEKEVFDTCLNLTSVELPESISTIEARTFFRCENMSGFVIPNSVTTIKENAFGSCYKLQNLIIPDSVTGIGANAFNGCTSLKTVSLSNSLTKIEDELFNGCYELSKITIPEGIATIGKMAFANMGALTTVELPTSVTLIDEKAFYDSYNLKTVKYAGTKAEWNNVHIISTGNEYLIAANKYFSDGDDTITEPTPPMDYTPKGIKLSKVTAKKKAFVVKWKKQTNDITGYEIQYSLKKNFSKAQIKKVQKNKTSFTVKKLKPKKKYFVRIRTYKTVNGQGTFYSDWSKAKTVKIKK